MTDTRDLALKIRRHLVRMTHGAKSSHVGSGLSSADILAVLYGQIMRVDPAKPKWSDRDRFLISKGHAGAALYAVLAERGFFPVAELDSYGQAGSSLLGHASHKVAGVELSTGSLGHALPVACGMALAAKRAGHGHRVFVLLSDGELDEGSNWESILFAAHHGLANLTVVVDYNKIQSFGSVAEVLEIAPLDQKWSAFRWSVAEIDGHDHAALGKALTADASATKPRVVLAHTIKGKGVSFMENDLAWHYKSPDAGQLDAALQELKSNA